MLLVRGYNNLEPSTNLLIDASLGRKSTIKHAKTIDKVEIAKTTY